jgi:hypothetical protein
MFIKILRRTHMYLALFLIPWILVYALSTLSMNHIQLLKDVFGSTPPQYTHVKEMQYPGVFSEDASPQVVAKQILIDLDLDGSHNIRGNLSDQQMTITRLDAIALKRITFFPKEKKITIEEADFQMPNFLRFLHTRRGYQHDYLIDDAWAFSVDLFLFTMLFWIFSGLWLWWKMKKTRRLGIICILGGIGLFCLFIFTI